MTTRVTYLSMDSVAEGIGASQVLAYVERLARLGRSIELHTFEKGATGVETEESLASLGVAWKKHAFGKLGSIAGLGRIMRGAVAVRGAQLLHARSELAAASALLARSSTWVWDMRSLYADQKIELGELRRGSPQHLVLNRVARASARRADAIVVLASAVIPELQHRYGDEIAEKIVVIPTCVDLNRFVPSNMPPGDLTLLLAGTLNAFYDVPAMLRFVENAKQRRKAHLSVVSPGVTRWDELLRDRADHWTSAAPAAMPDVIGTAHAGLCICRSDAGVSLKASMPTKIAEFLASGRPVIVNAGLGDVREVIGSNRCGVVVEATTDDAMSRAVDDLLGLIEDPETPQRCRRVAQKYFDLDRAAELLSETYDAMTKGNRPPRGLVRQPPLGL